MGKRIEIWKYADSVEQMFKDGWTAKALAKHFDVSLATIYKLLQERRDTPAYVEEQMYLPIADKRERRVPIEPPKVTYEGHTYNDLTKWFLESNYYEPMIVKRV